MRNILGGSDISGLVLVGEYTTPLGPFTEDYFLVLIFRNGEVREFPFGTEGVREFLQGFNPPIEPQLANKAEFCSAILWPLELYGEKWLIFEKANGKWRRLLGWLLPQRIQIRLAPIAKEYLSKVTASAVDVEALSGTSKG